jgi:hypothetical protein
MGKWDFAKKLWARRSTLFDYGDWDGLSRDRRGAL